MQSKLLRWQKCICITVFFSFSIYQIYITLLGSFESYPFSPYKMFSKNWRNGIVMERIRFELPNADIAFPWEFIRLPFFQVNHLSFLIFLDLQNEKAKHEFCKLPSMSRVKVLREEIRFDLKDQMMEQKIVKQGLVYACP